MRTGHFWRSWLADGNYPDHPWRAHLQRSALSLKGLTFMPTGALVAAPTTSLPETPGGERNWDYRYCWMRDASFTLWGLHALGLDWEADDFIQYVADLERNEDGSLQIMYGIRGEKDLEESTLDHLKGYEGARPVRIGNGAYNQRQNDVYGAVLDSVYLHSKQRDHIPERLWPVLDRPGQVRGGGLAASPTRGSGRRAASRSHYVSSKLMCWVAMDRGARLAERRGERRSGRKAWQAIADEIRADILGEGRRRARRLPPALRHRRARRLDAADAARCASCRPTTSASARRCARSATSSPRTAWCCATAPIETDDGQHGEEGTFLICSFWLVSALSEIGEHREAEHLCERLLAYASPLELYAEELEASSGRHLGNYPQAFTHLALINAVTHVIEAQQAAERRELSTRAPPEGARARPRPRR